MADNDLARRRRELTRRQSTRLATRAIRRALSELPAPIVKAIKPRAVVTTQRATEALAFASNPVSFTTQPTGELKAARSSLTGIARHEIAHLLGAGHPAIFAASGLKSSPSGGGLPTRGHQTLQASILERTPGLRSTRVLQGLARQRAFARLPRFPGFQTKHLQRLAETGTSEQRQRARQQMFKLGRRMKARGVDF